MNARQKAKRYKRLYEDSLKQPIKPIVVKEHHKIETLRYKRSYPEELIIDTTSTPNTSRYIQRDIALGFIDLLDKYIIYSMDYDPAMNVWSVFGELKVVVI